MHVTKRRVLFIMILNIFTSFCATAQGDGPRSWQLAPKGLWGVSSKWINLSQNIVPAGNLFIPGADIKVNVFPTAVFHTFSLGGRYAQLTAMINPGKVTGSVIPPPAYPPIPSSVNANGFSDGFVGIAVGLVNAPALDLIDFAQRKPAFSMNGMFRVWYSGTYERKKPLNLGTNRTAFQFGLPMSIPFGSDTKKPFWLETVPSVMFFTTNNEPTLITKASKSKQKPLLILENHLTKNLSTKFWAGVDLRFQSGGELKLDDVAQDNRLTILGGGISAGYQLLAPLSLNTSYGTILAGYNGAKSNMFRIGLTFVYVDMKKVKANHVKQ